MQKMKLFEPEEGLLTVKYAPDERTRLLENPPRFTWLSANMDEGQYVLQISTSSDFPEQETQTIQPIPYNFYTPDHPFRPGTYFWRYALLIERDEKKIQSEWSRVRSFTVLDQLPETPLPDRKVRYERTSVEHPRLWLNPERLSDFRKRVKQDPSYCNWNLFMEKSVLPWMERELIPEPAPYPNNKRVASLWRKMYMDCQEVLYAIRHLSVAGKVLEDSNILAKAKEWLLHVAGWDPEGTTSRDYNDEAAFRIAGALAWGYDWLWDELSEEERAFVRSRLLQRTEQVAYHVMVRSKIHHVPYDSHAVRSLSSVLVPACIALLHDEPKVHEWLDYTLEYYACLYSPWGGEDGGWAEGPMYWTTGMAYLIDALNLIKNYIGIDFYKRPFFQKTGDFPLYCYSPDTVRASFCDQSSLGDKPGLKTAFNIRQFAGVTGNGLYQWYYEQVRSRVGEEEELKYYNYGWWDFRFDDLMYRHDYPQVKSTTPNEESIQPVKWFRDVGWVAMHHRMEDPDEHIMLLTKSSRYGSLSHSHGDQNAFLIHAYGEPLAIESGYYVAFGSTMHLNWRRQTRSTNCLLIDGQGQYAGRNKELNLKAYGKIEDVQSGSDYGYVRADATAAYQENVPYLERFVREIWFFNRSYFVIVDSVDLSRPGQVEWLLHTLYPMELHKDRVRVIGQRAEMDVRFVYVSSGDMKLTQHDEFPDVDPKEWEGLPKQYHLHAQTPKATHHRIVTLLVPMKKDMTKYVSYFMDDQDHGVHLYFTNEEGITKNINIEKNY